MVKNATTQIKLGTISLLSGVLFLLGLFPTNQILAVKPESKTEFFGSGHGQSSINTGKPDRQFLIAASPQLNNLLYNLTYKVTSIARYYTIQSENYDQAYYVAWAEFYKIVNSDTIGNPSWSASAGWIYTGNLLGGGTSNLRQYGSSTPIMPTIDIFNHNTAPLGGQTFAQVREVKFPYKASLFCPVSTSPC